MPQGYSFQTKENMVKAASRNINISPKHAIEICNYIRGRPLVKAKMLLNQSITYIKPVPLKRFTNGPGHKPGMGSGRYMINACTEILNTLESAEANAKNKGLNVSDLQVVHIAAQRAGKQWHYGRKRRTLFKSCHIEVALEEVKGLKDKKGVKKPIEESKKVEKKMEHKEEHKHEAHTEHTHEGHDHAGHNNEEHTGHEHHKTEDHKKVNTKTQEKKTEKKETKE